MKSVKKQPISYNKQTPRELMMFTELIVEIYQETENAKWSNNSNIEIGFYIRDKKTKSNMFFGIWYESWESFGLPLGIAIDYTGNATGDMHQRIKRFVETNNNSAEKSLVFKIYQDFALVQFEHSFFNFRNDVERLKKLICELKVMLSINAN